MDGHAMAAPASVGLSSGRLARLDAALEGEVAAGRIPGAVVGIVRHGRLAHLRAVGYRDRETGRPMTADTLFWIASMTKPLTTVGALTFVEEGRLLLGNPVGEYLPAFRDKVIAVDPAAPLGRMRVVRAGRQPTIRDLLCHTAGIVEGLLGDTTVHRLYAEAVGDGMTSLSGREFIERLAPLPLLFEPGTRWHYGWGLDLVGQILEGIEGAPLGAILRACLFEPLGLRDTTFGVPVGQEDRLARQLAHDPGTGEPQGLPDLSVAGFDSGGAGLVSTAPDYLRFVQFLLDRGRVGSRQVLARPTIEHMCADQLAPGIDDRAIAEASDRLDGYGFGLGLAVRRRAGSSAVPGSPGQVTWGGAAGTYWWADPAEDLGAVLMMHAPSPAVKRRLFGLVQALVYGAIRD